MLDILGAAQKAASVFKENGWTYWGDDSPPEWPTLAFIIHDLLVRVDQDRIEQGDDFSQSQWATGRFAVDCQRIDDVDNFTICLELSEDCVDAGEELFS